MVSRLLSKPVLQGWFPKPSWERLPVSARGQAPIVSWEWTFPNSDIVRCGSRRKPLQSKAEWLATHAADVRATLWAECRQQSARGKAKRRNERAVARQTARRSAIARRLASTRRHWRRCNRAPWATRSAPRRKWAAPEQPQFGQSAAKSETGI